MARFVLVVSTAFTIAIFYVFIFVAMAMLLVWIAFFAALVIAAARFGLAGFILRFLERDIRVWLLLARSLWLRDRPVYRLPLERSDAPRLFAMLENLAGRLGIQPPDELCLEMNCGAWVELRGLKSGLGKTRVGVGYDLLAALSERHVEAVMAHELVHAQLIGRVLHNWMSRGLGRAASVASQLSALADAYRRANESFGPADWILGGADSLTQLCARQVAAYSRQGEFDADRGAAQLCGAAAICTALQRLQVVQPRLARLPWNERMAQIESPRGLSRWLKEELAAANDQPVGDEPEIFDRYSSHPSLSDRLAALTPAERAVDSGAGGLELLAAPDAVALKLVGAIEQTLLQAEREDLRDLRKWVRKLRRTGNYRWAQLPGIVTVVVGLLVSLFSFVGLQWSPTAFLAGLAVVALGGWFYRLGYYRDRRPLPVPDFDRFMNARKDFAVAEVATQQKEMEAKLRAEIPADSTMKHRAEWLTREAYAALAGCDYLRAGAAARLAWTTKGNSLEAKLVELISAGALGQGDRADELYREVLRKTGLRSPSSAWAVAWTLILNGEWTRAEALLHLVIAARPGEASLLEVLALCQGRRGKLQSAITALRTAAASGQRGIEHLKLHVSFLLDRGALREAWEVLGLLPTAAADPETVFLRLRFHLLRREFPEAEAQLGLLEAATLPGHRLLALGLLYEEARADDAAEKFFERAIALGHYPQAWLARARLAAQRRDKVKAREYVELALDLNRPLAEKAVPATDLFQGALTQLVGLEEADLGHRAWISSTLPGTEVGPLSKRSLVIFARNEAEAVTYFQRLLRAMKPDTPPPTAARLTIKLAPGDMQPNRPVRPGVQYVYQ